MTSGRPSAVLSVKKTAEAVGGSEARKRCKVNRSVPLQPLQHFTLPQVFHAECAEFRGVHTESAQSARIHTDSATFRADPHRIGRILHRSVWTTTWTPAQTAQMVPVQTPFVTYFK
jgi:hypothetical protein